MDARSAKAALIAGNLLYQEEKPLRRTHQRCAALKPRVLARSPLPLLYPALIHGCR